VNEARAAGRYDFRMGRKLTSSLEECGFTVVRELTLHDAELSFQGPARDDVLEAWRARLERMKLLRELAGDDFTSVQADFLGCLASPEHRSHAEVCCCCSGVKSGKH
jgi:hypothetical protein